MNVGIHHRRAALDPNNKLRNIIVKGQSQQTKIFKDTGNNFVTNIYTEDYCQIKHLYCQHFALQNLPLEFVIPMNNKWEIHNFNFVNPFKTFVVLAESKKTPQIIYFEPHCVATLFDISKTYPQTYDILKNFITAKLTAIKEFDIPEGTPIATAIGLYRGIPNNYFKLSGRAQARHYKEINETKKISVLKNEPTGLTESVLRPNTNRVYHVGHTFTRHHEAPLIVQNNTLHRDIAVKMDPTKRAASSFIIQKNRYSLSEKRGPSIKSMPNIDRKQSVNSSQNSQQLLAQIGGKGAFLTGVSSTEQGDYSTSGSDQSQNKKSTERSRNTIRTVRFLDSMDETVQETKSNQKMETESEANKTTTMHLTRAQIAEMIYPDFPVRCLEQKELWVSFEPYYLFKNLWNRFLDSYQRDCKPLQMLLVEGKPSD